MGGKTWALLTFLTLGVISRVAELALFHTFLCKSFLDLVSVFFPMKPSRSVARDYMCEHAICHTNMIVHDPCKLYREAKSDG